MIKEQSWNWLLGNLSLQSFSIVNAIEDPTINEIIAASAALMVVLGAILIVALLTYLK